MVEKSDVLCVPQKACDDTDVVLVHSNPKPEIDRIEVVSNFGKLKMDVGRQSPRGGQKACLKKVSTCPQPTSALDRPESRAHAKLKHSTEKIKRKARLVLKHSQQEGLFTVSEQKSEHASMGSYPDSDGQVQPQKKESSEDDSGHSPIFVRSQSEAS